MNTLEIGKKLVAMCREGKNVECIQELYDRDIVSVEAQAMPNMPAEMRGIDAIVQKNRWWVENHEVHSASAEGPWPHGDRFIVRFAYDVTNKPSGQRMKLDEVGLYTVKGGKIVREEFFYAM
jgi:hypothetical protein